MEPRIRILPIGLLALLGCAPTTLAIPPGHAARPDAPAASLAEPAAVLRPDYRPPVVGSEDDPDEPAAPHHHGGHHHGGS